MNRATTSAQIPSSRRLPFLRPLVRCVPRQSPSVVVVLVPMTVLPRVRPSRSPLLSEVVGIHDDESQQF